VTAAVLRPEVGVLAPVGRNTPIHAVFSRLFHSSALIFTFAATFAIEKSTNLVLGFLKHSIFGIGW
jgi:hypothetical protein